MGSTKVTVRMGYLVCCVGFLSVSTILGGCRNMGTQRVHVCQVVVGNRSQANVLRSVVIDSKGVRLDFGYFGKGHPKSLAGAGHQQIRFADDFAIAWEEDGVARETLVDIKQYEKKKDRIKSFSFFYNGKDRWQVIAQDDITPDATEVKP